MIQQFPVPTDWKSEKWWNNRSPEERVFHLRVPKKWQSVDDLPLPKAVQAWLKDYKYGSSLYLYGPSGSGKTAIAQHVLKYLVSTQPLSGRFVSSEKYIEMIKDSFENDGFLPEMYSTPYLLKYLQGVYSVLLLDSVGNERETDFSVHEIGSLIRRRNEDMRSLIITTTMNTIDFTRRYGERVAGSVNEMHIVRI
jgi:DNA replication protein DnaC